MIILAHSLVGAVIATKTESLPVAFLLGLTSHFVLDAIPHLDPGTIFNPYGRKNIKFPKWVYPVILADFAVTLICFYFLRHNPDFNLMVAGAIGAVSVDIIENFPVESIRNLPVLKQIQWLHNKAHYWLPTEKWYWGALTSITLISFAIYCLKAL